MKEFKSADLGRINLYIHKLMPQENKLKFEQELKDNSALAEEVEFQQFIEMYKADSLKKRLEFIYQYIKDEQLPAKKEETN